MKPKIYYIDDLDLEVHQFGFYVSVVWNTKEEEEKDGNRIITTRARVGKPYISFLWIRDENPNDIWVDEDKTISGGLTVDQAEEVARGLTAAAAYIRSGV